MKLIPPTRYEVPKPYHVPGTTKTVPGLAPTLAELIQMNLAGEALPLVGKQLYDDSEAAGLARTAAPSDLTFLYSQAEQFIPKAPVTKVEETKVEETKVEEQTE